MASIKLRRRAVQPGTFQPQRARVIYYLLTLACAVVTVRAVWLHSFLGHEDSLSSIADNQYQKSIELAPYRGTIFDRRGDPLAISIKKPSLAVNPRIFSPTTDEIHKLSRLLGLSKQTIKNLAERKNYFAWLKRQIDFRVAEQVLRLGIRGINEIKEPARFYPGGPAASQMLGYVGTDNIGLAGLEMLYEKDLRGQPLFVSPSKDAKNKIIFTQAKGASPEKTGNSLHLTIDSVIQEIVDQELAEGVKTAKAIKGYVIVSDPHTGKILAVSNFPAFNPNYPRDLQVGQTVNHALSDTFEPGSVTKPFIVGRAVDLGATTFDAVHDCEDGWMQIGKHRIHDSHRSKNLNTEEVLIHSSNVCMYKIAGLIGKEQTDQALKLFGIGSREMRMGFPGEALGYIPTWKKWPNIRFANVSFGHGFMTTSLELVQAMGVLANGGNLMKPYFLERIVSSDGVVIATQSAQVLRQVLTTRTATKLRSALQKVVDLEEGTGNLAATPHYTTAGKTGTAQKVVPGVRGYAKGKYLASFLGFAPVSDPRLVVYVVIDEPDQKRRYGGLWAAPVFSRIVERSLKYLNVAPDKTPPESSRLSQQPTNGMSKLGINQTDTQDKQEKTEKL